MERNGKECIPLLLPSPLMAIQKWVADRLTGIMGLAKAAKPNKDRRAPNYLAMQPRQKKGQRVGWLTGLASSSCHPPDFPLHSLCDSLTFPTSIPATATANLHRPTAFIGARQWRANGGKW